MSDHVLVTGGAGYIGSHACKGLARAGFVPVAFDNLSTGWAEAVKFGPFVQGDLLDRAATALGTDRSSFLLAQGRLAAQRVLADRDFFLLDADAQQEWERINSSPARSLPGLERLLERPSPFGWSA